MKVTVSKAIKSTCSISVTLDTTAQNSMKEKALKTLQKDVKIAGFRPGHVPLHIVEKQLQPGYLKMTMMEEAINESIKNLLKENPDQKFIGQPYDIQEDTKDDLYTITYKLDVYPEVEVKNTSWEKLTISSVDTDIESSDIAKAIENLQKQYAEYTDAEIIENDSLVKAKCSMKDKDGQEIHTLSAFFGKEEFDESKLLREGVSGKIKNDTTSIPYKEKDLPHAVHYHPHGDEKAKLIKTVDLTIIDIKKMTLPDLSDGAVLQKLFQAPDITSRSDLEKKVEEVLREQKQEAGLQKAVEDMLLEAKESFHVDIPDTIIKEEMGARIKQLGDRMGGEAGLKQYFEKIGQEKTNELYDDIQKSARESLEKFFMLRKLTELLGVTDIHWNNALDAEKKLYAHFTANGKTGTKKAPAKKGSAKEEKEITESAPAKKTTRKKKSEDTAE